MSQARFSRRVSELMEQGTPAAKAIEQAAQEAANYRDPFEVMRERAMSK